MSFILNTLRDQRRATRSLLMVAGLSISLSPTLTQGTTVRPLSLPQMVQQAEDVVQARVLENKVRTNPDTLHHWTVTTFQALETAKGSMRPGEIFTIEVLGGEAPGSGYATIVADAPRFQLDEEVVLFSYGDDQGRRQLVGFFQGAVRLRTTPDGLMTRGTPPDIGNAVTPAPASGRAPGHRAGSPAPAASPAVQRGGGRPVTAAQLPKDKAMPAQRFMQRLRELDAETVVQP